ncbi:hypothetical protein OG521_37080 [Streptomyces sp. NBC_01463]
MTARPPWRPEGRPTVPGMLTGPLALPQQGHRSSGAQGAIY